jgi:hypothetical protein
MRFTRYAALAGIAAAVNITALSVPVSAEPAAGTTVVVSADGKARAGP